MTYFDFKSILEKQMGREKWNKRGWKKREEERDLKGKAIPQAPAGKRKERVLRQISLK